MRKLVILESPYRATTKIETDVNIDYARKAVRDSLGRDEAPIASHLLYTQKNILDDNVAEERLWGIEAGLAWTRVAETCVVYIDRGISSGMCYGIVAAAKAGMEIKLRLIEED